MRREWGQTGRTDRDNASRGGPKGLCASDTLPLPGKEAQFGSLSIKVPLMTASRQRLFMKGWATLPIAVTLLLCGCTDPVSRAKDLAVSGRQATEQYAASSETTDESRDTRIFDDAPPTRSGPGFALGERYYVHADAKGWSVYDRVSGDPARLGQKVQSGLSYEKAQEAASILQASDHERWR